MKWKRIDICREFMLSNTAVLIYLSLLKFCVHFFVNLDGGYGLHRDEFYYLACADHIDFGYVDHPPLSILLLAISRLFFGDSVLAVRLLPAIAGAACVLITGFIVRELGGRGFAQILGAISFIFVPTFLYNHNVFSMNALDQLIWPILIFIFIRTHKSGNLKGWLWFGIFAGIGLQNKISVLFLIAGLISSLLITRNHKYVLNRYFYIGAFLAIVIFLPHILWQIINGWPTLEFISNARATKIADFTLFEFFMAQVDMLNPPLFFFWMSGLLCIFIKKLFRGYRFFGVMYLIIFFGLAAQKSKPYYLMPIYPLLLAFAAIFFEKLFDRSGRTWFKPILIVYIIFFGIRSAPFVLPVLPVETYVKYSRFWGDEPIDEEKHDMGVLPPRFADMHGWENLVATVARVFHSLSDEEKSKAAILVNNYGEAGAIDYFRKKYRIPRAIAGHNSYWHWGCRGATGELIIRLGGTQEDYLKSYEKVSKISVVLCKYCMPYENNLPVFVCRGLKQPLADVWPLLKHYD